MDSIDLSGNRQARVFQIITLLDQTHFSLLLPGERDPSPQGCKSYRASLSSADLQLVMPTLPHATCRAP